MRKGVSVRCVAALTVVTSSCGPLPLRCSACRVASRSDEDIIENTEPVHQLAAVAVGRGCGSDRPGHDVDILLLEQRLEPGQIVFAPGLGVSVEKAADQQVGLLGAAMPGTKAEASQAGVAVHNVQCGLAGEGFQGPAPALVMRRM